MRACGGSARVRVTTATTVQLGRFRTLDLEQLRLTLPGGQQSSVPLAALTQVEVRGVSRSSVVTGIAAGGGLLFGAAGVLLCNSFNKELSDNGNTAPLPVCGAMGAVLGGALGAGFGLLGTRDWAEWKPVWAR